MLPILRATLLLGVRSPATWIGVVLAAFVAWIGASLDLFAFEGPGASAAATILGTLEIAVVLLAIRTRLAGLDAGNTQGLRPELEQRVGAFTLDAGASLGSGAAAGTCCAAAWITLIVLYNVYPHMDVGAPALVVLALAAEGSVAAAWAGFARRRGGGVVGLTVAMAGFALARTPIPEGVRAVLPAPLALSCSMLATRTACAVLATLGLCALSALVPSATEESS